MAPKYYDAKNNCWYIYFCTILGFTPCIQISTKLIQYTNWIPKDKTLIEVING